VNAAINLRLALLGLPLAAGGDGASVTDLMAPILARQREQSRRLADKLCPVDTRIQNFLKEYLADVGRRPVCRVKPWCSTSPGWRAAFRCRPMVTLQVAAAQQLSAAQWRSAQSRQ
jgi:hypothetical protein